METITHDNLYTQAGDILTRLTLDARAAVAEVKDEKTREYAFRLIHLSRDLTGQLITGIWKTPEEAGKAILSHLVLISEKNPSQLPDWAQKLAPTWKKLLV